MHHIPVLLKEILAISSPNNESIVLDCTFGAGGYSKGFLELGAKKVIAIDRDSSVSVIASNICSNFNDRFTFHNISYSDIGSVVERSSIDIIVYDLGVSSMQLDLPYRGFSFANDGPLDMRMNPSEQTNTAKDIINTASESDLADIIFKYGDERKSRAIAKKICSVRSEGAISTTLELASIVASVVGYHGGKIHPATKTFQALRIAVNNELEDLEKSLYIAKDIIKPSGIIAVVSFHSGEDVIVKNIFNKWLGKSQYAFNPFGNIHNQHQDIKFKLLTKKPITPHQDEVRLNHRSRSAKLRVIQKLEN